VQLTGFRAAYKALLHDGSIATIRGVTSTDAADIQRFIRNLSPSSRYLRFLMAIRELPQEMLHRFTHPAKDREFVLVASTTGAGIVGMTQYVVDDDAAGCELAIVVGDAWQRQGLGCRLLQMLSRIAACNGIRYGHADVLADNHAMRSLAGKFGCEIRTNMQAPFLLKIRKDFDAADALSWPASLERSAGTRRYETNHWNGR